MRRNTETKNSLQNLNKLETEVLTIRDISTCKEIAQYSKHITKLANALLQEIRKQKDILE